jgi:hypothetical protein
MAATPSPSPGSGGGAIPPPPDWKRESLKQELETRRHQLAAMQALLNDLPQIFESRFEGRLRPLLEQKQRLLEGNRSLREQLSQWQRATPPDRGRQHWSRNLRHAFGLGGGRRS